MSESVWSAHYGTAAGYRHWPCEELVRAIGDRQFGRVLEVGCGNGANLHFLAGHAQALQGIDWNRDAVHAAREKLYDTYGDDPSLGVEQGDATRMATPDVPFDLVVDCMFSQHLPWAAHLAQYQQYARLLAPGGTLFLYHLDDGTHTPAGVPSARLRQMSGTPDRELVPLFPTVGLTCLPGRAELTQLVVGAGFRVTSVRGLARTYDDEQVASYTVILAEAQ